MFALLLIVGILQGTPAKPAPEAQNVPQSCGNAQISRSRDDILKCRPEVEKRAAEIQAASSSAKSHDQAIANAALELAKQEEAKGEESCQAEQQIVDYYQIAQGSEKVDQQALAINNLASFYWRCQKADLAKKTMQSLPYEKLTTPAQAAFYLDNYSQLLTLTGDFIAAAAHYKSALLNSPADQRSLMGLSSLFGQNKLPVPFVTVTADLLADKRQTRTAVDLVLSSASSAKQLSVEESRELMLSLVHAYAVGSSTSVEFAKFDQSRLQQIAGSHKETISLIQELNTAFLEKFRVDALPPPAPNQSTAGGHQNSSIVQQTSLPILPRVDHAISETFRTPERKVIEQLFPSWILAGGADELSLVLSSVAEECAHKGDISCAGHKYAAAWLLEPRNTEAALQLAILYKTGSIPELNQWVSHEVVEYYSPKRSVLASLYSEPSQRFVSNTDEIEKAKREQIYKLLALKASETATVSPDSGSFNHAVFMVSGPLYHGDILLRGSAPANVEAIYIATFRNNKAKCEVGNSISPTTMGQDSPNSPYAAMIAPVQYSMVATDAHTGSFKAPLREALTRGEIVCIYQLVNGVPEGKPIQEVVQGVPFFDHMRNYLVAGGFLGNSVGELHFLPRVAVNSDLSLARWGYNPYQDQSSHPYTSLTVLVNVYEEFRFTAIPKAASERQGGSGVTDVASFEFGTYAPMFLHHMTWRFLDYQRAFFAGPLVRGGIDLFPGHGTEDAFAAGARLGVLRLAHSSRFSAPELQSYLDIVYGNSTNLVVDQLTERTQRLHQVDFTGMLKIPETPFYLGLNTAVGPGPKQTGIFVGARFEVGRLLHPASAQ